MKLIPVRKVILYLLAVITTVVGLITSYSKLDTVRYSYKKDISAVVTGDTGDEDYSEVLTEEERTALNNYNNTLHEGEFVAVGEDYIHSDEVINLAYPEQRVGAVLLELMVTPLVTLQKVELEFELQTESNSSVKQVVALPYVLGGKVTKVYVDSPESVQSIRLTNASFDDYHEGVPKYYSLNDSKAFRLIGETSIECKVTGTALVENKYGMITDTIECKSGDTIVTSYSPVGIYLEE